ncbi:MAG: DUF1801 domain-containing protein [Microbacterium sp.]
MTTNAIDSYLEDVAEPPRAALTELCRIITSSDDRVRGEIKWNAPSFAIDDHFATTGIVRGGGIRLVLHTGARRMSSARSIVIQDPEKLLDWRDADRAVALFDTVDDVRRHEASLRAILTAWIDQTQRAVR